MNTYEYQRFLKIAADNGIAKSTVRSRLKNGMSMEEAVTCPIQRGRVATGVKTVCGIKLTEAQTNQVRINEVGHDTLRRRVKNGMSLDEAISAPVIRRTHDAKQVGDPETLEHIRQDGIRDADVSQIWRAERPCKHVESRKDARTRGRDSARADRA